MGMALTSCITPANGTPSFEIGDDEIEIGIGIHGEPGMSREKIKPADEITEMMMNEIIDDKPYKRTLKEWSFEKDDWEEVEVVDAPFEKGDQFIVFVNSMGGTPVSELYAIYRKVSEVMDNEALKSRGILLGRILHHLKCRDVLLPC